MTDQDRFRQVKDTMWFFLSKGGQRANLEGLKENVSRMIRMATQKTAGQPQYAKKGDINVAENLEATEMAIICEATALVLDPRFDELLRGFNCFDTLVDAIAKSNLCVNDTALPHPEDCSTNCADCYRQAVLAAAGNGSDEEKHESGAPFDEPMEARV